MLMAGDVREGVSATVPYLEQGVGSDPAMSGVGVVSGVSGHLRRVQPMIAGITLIKHHLSRLVKDLRRAVVRRLVGLTRAVVNEQVGPDDHEVIVHIGYAAM